jgi:hypothetical protein
MGERADALLEETSPLNGNLIILAGEFSNHVAALIYITQV